MNNLCLKDLVNTGVNIGEREECEFSLVEMSVLNFIVFVAYFYVSNNLLNIPHIFHGKVIKKRLL